MTLPSAQWKRWGAPCPDLRAEVVEGTASALRADRQAHGLAERDEIDVDVSPQPLGEPAVERGGGLLGGECPDQSNAIDDAMDVGVDRNRVLPMCRGHDDARNLGSHAWESEEFVHRVGNTSIVLLDERGGEATQCPRLHAEESGWAQHRLEPPRRQIEDVLRGADHEKEALEDGKEANVARPWRKESPHRDPERVALAEYVETPHGCIARPRTASNASQAALEGDHVH